MEVKASLVNIGISPIKLALVARQIKGEKAVEALQRLKLVDKKAASAVYKCLHSAVDSAIKNHNLGEDNLKVQKVWVTKGKGRTSRYSSKRWRWVGKGGLHQYQKHRANLYIILTNGTKD